LRKNKKTDIDMDLYLSVLETLIKEDKIEFEFYNNFLLKLDLLQIYYNKHEDKIEIEFRDVMEEHLDELKRIMNLD